MHTRRFRFIYKRLLSLIPLILAVLFVTTVLLDLTPGDPARLVAGPRADDEQVQEVSKQLGLDRPLLVRYALYVWGILHGDFGTSFKTGKDVGAQIAAQLPITLSIAFGAIVFALLITVPVAMWAAKHEGRWQDHLTRVVGALCIGLPSFWVAIMLITYVALPSGKIPVAGIGETAGQHVLAMLLPIVTVSLGLIPPMVRSLRATLLETEHSDFVLAAQTLGFSGRELTWSFIMRNAVGPLVTVATAQAGFALFGTTVVEVAFGLPGIGQGLVTAASSRDFPLVQGYTFVFAVIIIVLYLVSDVISAAVDPRVRIES